MEKRKYEIVGIKDGELQLKTKDSKFVTLTKDNMAEGFKVIDSKVSHLPKEKSETKDTDTTVENEDNPEEVYEANLNVEAEPHAPFTNSFTNFFRTKGNQEVFEKDPVKLQREKLIKMGCEKDVLRLEKEINQQIETSIERAKMAPFASLDELKIDVYAHE